MGYGMPAYRRTANTGGYMRVNPARSHSLNSSRRGSSGSQLCIERGRGCLATRRHSLTKHGHGGDCASSHFTTSTWQAAAASSKTCWFHGQGGDCERNHCEPNKDVFTLVIGRVYVRMGAVGGIALARLRSKSNNGVFALEIGRVYVTKRVLGGIALAHPWHKSNNGAITG